MASRSSWRLWLERNHDTKKETWLVFYKKHMGKLNVTYDEAVEEALCFGWIDSILKRINDEKFIRRFTPRKPESKWSELNRKRATKMVNEGKMTKAGLELIIEAKKRGQWNKPFSQRKSFAVPKYFEEALELNEKASDSFSRLALSYKTQYIGWIDSAKREETRKRRLAEVVRVLKKGEKLGMK